MSVGATNSKSSASCVSSSHLVPSQPINDSTGVLVHADIEGQCEFASEIRGLALRLVQQRFPIQIAPRAGQQLQSHSPSLRSLGKHLKYLLHDRLDLAESVLYQSGPPTRWNLDFYGRCRVGRTAFGTDRIPDGWADRCNALDELWLLSEFHRDIFAAHGVVQRKIHVLPLGIDCDVFRRDRPPLRLRGLPQRSFRFAAIADGWLASGVDLLVRAFVEEFSPDEDVALFVYCPPNACGDHPIDVEAEVIAFVETNLGRNLEDVPSIALLMGVLAEEERAALLAASHAFVSPVRANATGRHCLEALACQLPVIATAWGPLHHFLTEQNSFPLATTGLVAAQSQENELFAGHRWAEPDVDHLRDQMRQVFENSNEATRRAEQGHRDVCLQFEWSAVLPEWIRNFRRLLE